MTHIACDVGDVEQDITFPKLCCPGMCVRQTNQAVLQCAQAFRRLLDKIAKATDGEYLKVAFAERMFVVELHNIGNTVIHGTLPGFKKVRFCGELVLANGAFGYGEASQVYLTYTTPYQFEARDDGPIEYEGHVIQPSFEQRVEVERASADRFGSPLGAMLMCTQKGDGEAMLRRLVGDRHPPAVQLLVARGRACMQQDAQQAPLAVRERGSVSRLAYIVFTYRRQSTAVYLGRCTYRRQ